ncbi:CcoQ/FixQ family Cbb3-type cytochrome c oxidase assembly chaperone [Lacihabitans sp. LS3-19]|uniref:CcoQ/FixQ family Cbb3-type cytochrome c oxidase assembly chaperone n=1 Tax=Lacihabitans sp. LS3-19 TaxID=2487335 RepID=UPI0020CF9725|nr:CcoQ/FixQ family Cbb3-type cytochrome c oxidase assembly chaperone [Lacihabitans sp. LS3-19]MCP9766814.1 CcoQ/FixQ family Cbb3-type cytochrome c oxidase assembly chaperone [Lacihabitans sp. LS3-19]
MIRNSRASISDVAIYPIISLVIFVSFFVLLGYLVFKADKKYIKHMEELPLQED